MAAPSRSRGGAAVGEEDGGAGEGDGGAGCRGTEQIFLHVLLEIGFFAPVMHTLCARQIHVCLSHFALACWSLLVPIILVPTKGSAFLAHVI
jgi:hypothetical protein